MSGETIGNAAEPAASVNPDRLETLIQARDYRAVPAALEHFAANPSPDSIRLLRWAAETQGRVLPPNRRVAKAEIRFTYSLEAAISDVLRTTPVQVQRRCLAELGRPPSAA